MKALSNRDFIEEFVDLIEVSEDAGYEPEPEDFDDDSFEDVAEVN